jgi:shikimate kinase
MSGEVRGIVLVGYRATGKSTVGRLVAERLARPFLDLDREVEALEGRSIRSIFLEAGELAFRELESRVIGGLADRLAGGVVATGGGAILRESNG